MRTVIPAVEIFVCDRCGRESKPGDTIPFRHHAVVRVKEASIGYDGSAGGGDWQAKDLCGRCIDLLSLFFKGFAIKAAEEAK